MIPQEIGASISSRVSVEPQKTVSDTTINGTSIDRMPTGSQQGFLSAEGVVFSGEDFAAGTLDYKLQDSADGSAFADIAAAQGGPINFPQITAVSVTERLSINLKPLRQFVRLVATTAGSTTDTDHAGLLILGGATNPPVD